jgi:hypothetical protein
MYEQSTPSASARPAPTNLSFSNIKHLNMLFENETFKSAGFLSPNGAIL